MNVRQFVNNYTPNLTPVDEKIRVYSNTLFYHKPDLRFTVEEVKQCLSDYLTLMDSGVQKATAFLQKPDTDLNLANERDVKTFTREILRSYDHIEFSELMQVYLLFAPSRDHDFITFLHSVNAVERVERFLLTLNPHRLYIPIDVYKRVAEVYDTLLYIQKP